MPDNVWWKGLHRVPIEKQTYKCSCLNVVYRLISLKTHPKQKIFTGCLALLCFVQRAGKK